MWTSFVVVSSVSILFISHSFLSIAMTRKPKSSKSSHSKKSSSRSGNSGSGQSAGASGSSGSGQSYGSCRCGQSAAAAGSCGCGSGNCGNASAQSLGPTSDSRIGVSQGQGQTSGGSGHGSSSSAAAPSGSASRGSSGSGHGPSGSSSRTSSGSASISKTKTKQDKSHSRSQSQGSNGKLGSCSGSGSRSSCCSGGSKSCCKTNCCKTSCCAGSKTSQGSKGSRTSSKGSISGNGQTKGRPSCGKGSASAGKGTLGAQGKTQVQGKTQGQPQPEGEDGESVSGVFQKDPKMNALFKKKHYIALQRIAHGAFGQVYKGAKTDNAGQPLMDQLIAIKVIEMTRLQPVFREKYLPQELAALTHVKHDNIIQVFDIFRANERLFVLMEFAPNGDLSGFMKKSGPMKERLAQFWFSQVVTALMHVHATLRMAHRDIKLDNVLLNGDFDAKLSDFGFAKECWDSKRHCAVLSQTICGTQPYFCPQLVDRVPYNAYMADVWAMGVMLFVMLNYRFPFHFDQDPSLWMVEMTNYPIFLKTRFLPTVSSKAQDFVVALLNPSEKERMTLHEAKKHEWLAKMNDKKAPIDA